MIHRLSAFTFGLLLAPLLFTVSAALAQSDVERLQTEIATRGDRLANIEAEIRQYEAALLEVGAEKRTLQTAINQLELERRKVQADIQFTEGKLDSTDLAIEKLKIEISRAETGIEKQEEALGNVLREISTADDDSLIELLLRHDNISEFWNSIEELETVRNGMGNRVKQLSELKDELIVKRLENESQRQTLVSLQSQYADQRQILEGNKAEKDTLLQRTRSEEAEYQALLKEKQDAREQLTKELRDFEAQLQFILDPTTIPARGTRVFDWPLANIIITQYFGGTEFAKNNPGIYGRAYHPGVDFGAPVGTKIFAPLSGTVRWTDNTDRVPGCYAWGKWILIDHANGLSTLYAHLSHVSVQAGQKVSTGEIIGYTGATGYVTGPHLHFTVYAKDAVEVIRYSDFKTITSCGPAYTPRAASEGYINPMDYLPPV